MAGVAVSPPPNGAHLLHQNMVPTNAGELDVCARRMSKHRFVAQLASAERSTQKDGSHTRPIATAKCTRVSDGARAERELRAARSARGRA